VFWGLKWCDIFTNYEIIKIILGISKNCVTVNSENIACNYYCDSSTADKNARFNYCDVPR